MEPEHCPFCWHARCSDCTVVLTDSTDYVVCSNCGGGAETKWWYPSFALRVAKTFEVIQ